MMKGEKKDARGRNLRVGETYDAKNRRYMFRKMINGERVSITAPNLAELRKQETDLLYRIDRGGRLKAGGNKTTLNEYFDYWLEIFAKSGRKSTTCQNYKSYYNTYIRDTIGKKPIAKIIKADCQLIINEMVEDGKKHSTMSNLKSCLKLVFEAAVDDDLILKNPAKNLQVPQTESQKREAIEQRQVGIFMEYVRNSEQYSYSYPAFVTLFNCGLRIGEMAALTWADVDFKNDSIVIDKQLNRYRKKDYGFTVGIASPKSKTSVRKVTMNSTVKRTLMRLKMQSKPSTAKLPRVDDLGHVRSYTTDFVFVNSIGNPWTEPTFRELIKRIVEHLNEEARENHTEEIKIFTPHMTWHTYVSLAYSAGADVKIVSEAVGHASTSVTMNTYVHLSEEKKKEQEAVLQSIKIM